MNMNYLSKVLDYKKKRSLALIDDVTAEAISFT